MGPYGQIIQEIKATAKDFLSIYFVHERRESIMDAHSLARPSLHKDIGQLAFVTRTRFRINKRVSGFAKKKNYSFRFKLYFLHIKNRSHLGQRHGLQSITLIAYFYKNIY